MPTSKRRRCTRERIRGGSLKSLRRCYRRSCGRHVSRLPTNSSPHRRLPLYAEPKLANSALKREAEQTTPHKNSQRINAGVPEGGASQRRPAEWGADRPASRERLGGPAGRGGGRLRSGRLGFLLGEAVQAYERRGCGLVISARKTPRLVGELKAAEWKPSPRTDAD